MVRYLFYTIGDLTYQSPLVRKESISIRRTRCVFVSENPEKSSGFKFYWSFCLSVRE